MTGQYCNQNWELPLEYFVFSYALYYKWLQNMLDYYFSHGSLLWGGGGRGRCHCYYCNFRGQCKLLN